MTHGAVEVIDRLQCSLDPQQPGPPASTPKAPSRLNGLRTAVDLDAHGMGGLAAHRLNSRAGRVVVSHTPNPTGVSVTADRAAELRGVLAGYAHVLVIEDDHSPLFPHALPPRYPPTTRHWALVRSVAKFLGPDVRVAAIASEPEPPTWSAPGCAGATCQPPPAATRRRVADCKPMHPAVPRGPRHLRPSGRLAAHRAGRRRCRNAVPDRRAQRVDTGTGRSRSDRVGAPRGRLVRPRRVLVPCPHDRQTDRHPRDRRPHHTRTSTNLRRRLRRSDLDTMQTATLIRRPASWAPVGADGSAMRSDAHRCG